MILKNYVIYMRRCNLKKKNLFFVLKYVIFELLRLKSNMERFLFGFLLKK